MKQEKPNGKRDPHVSQNDISLALCCSCTTQRLSVLFSNVFSTVRLVLYDTNILFAETNHGPSSKEAGHTGQRSEGN